MAQHAAESRAGAQQAELAARARSRQLGADPGGEQSAVEPEAAPCES